MKCALSYAGGMGAWGAIFYAVGYRYLHARVTCLAVAYAILAAVVGISQLEIYRSEAIRESSARLHRRVVVAFSGAMALWTAAVGWLVASGAIHWGIALVCWAGGSAVGVISSWVAYKSALKWRLDSRHNARG